ncbi:hypothetical protein ACLB2K_069132 [Fragaria x ananassa]
MFSQHSSNRFSQIEKKSGRFLQELQKIWDEVGVTSGERDTMLLKIEEACMEVFRTKVDEAEQCKAQLQQAIANYEAEFVDICAALGEKPPHLDHKTGGSLKKELEIIIPQLEVMKKRKIERKDQIFSVLDQLQKISKEISRSLEDNLYKMVVEETDLSLKRLEELRRQLLEYQDEKRNRLTLIMDHMNILKSLCLVLGLDFEHTIHKIHPTLDDREGEKDVTNITIEGLANSIQILREVKIQRWHKLQTLASALLEMWNLMDTPLEEQKRFQNVTSCLAVSESDITEPNILSVDLLNDVEAEVSRLEQLKSSKLKEILLKKKLELEEKRFQGQLLAEKEVLYGSKHSATKSGKKVSDRKMSLGGALIRNQKIEKAAPHVHPIKKGNSHNQRSSHHQFSAVEASSLGRRGLEFSGHSVKNQPSTAAKTCEMESPLIRKPLSPVSSKVSTKANILNFLEDQKRQQKNIEPVHLFKEVPIMSPSIEAVPLFSEVPIMTPSKPIIVNDEENTTPKTMRIQVPPTPSTMSVYTLTATPATPFTYGAHNKVEKSNRQVEYKFEEARAGFNCPKSSNASS